MTTQSIKAQKSQHSPSTARINWFSLLSLAMLSMSMSPTWANSEQNSSPQMGTPISVASNAAYRYALPYTNVQQVRLNRALANHLLLESIVYDMPKLAYSAILRGADYKLLNTNSIRLRDWEFLQIYEHFAAMDGNPVTYTTDCWEELLFQNEMSPVRSDLNIPYDAINIIPHLISKGVDINATTSKGNTALKLAYEAKSHFAAELILAAGGNPESIRYQERWELFRTSKKQGRRNWYENLPLTTNFNKALHALSTQLCSLGEMDETKLKALNDAMAQVDALPLEEAQTIKNKLLHQEVFSGCLAGVQYLVEEGSNVNFCLFDTNGEELLSYEVATKANINSTALDGREKSRTVLAAAIGALRFDKDIVSYLMEQGARFINDEAKGSGINTQDTLGRTPLMHHLMGNLHSGTGDNAPDKSTRLHLELGADIQALDRMGQNAIFYALRDTSVRNLETLIEAGADVNCIPKGQHATAVYQTMASGNIISTFLLLESGADPFINGANGNPILPSVQNADEESRLLLYQLFEAYRCAWRH